MTIKQYLGLKIDNNCECYRLGGGNNYLVVNLNINAIKNNANNKNEVYLNFKAIKNIPENKITVSDNKGNTLVINYSNRKILQIDLKPFIEANSNEITIKSDYLIGPFDLFSFKEKDTKKHPSITFIDTIDETRKSEYKDYQIDKRNTFSVNLYDPCIYKYHHYDMGIKNNSLKIDLYHVFDNDNEIIFPTYMGNHIKTSLHQYIKVENIYNDLLNTYNVIYVDGEGLNHRLYEKFYYLDEEERKHYVNKKDVYLDDDSDIKIKVNDKIYKVKMEMSNDDGLMYLSYKTITNFDNRKLNKSNLKYYLELGDKSKIYLSLKTGNVINVPIFYCEDEEDGNSDYYDYEDVILNSTQYIGKNDKQVLSVLYRNFKLQSDINGLYFYNSFINKKVYLVIEKRYIPTNGFGVYVNEDIENINQQIEQLENTLLSYNRQINALSGNYSLYETQDKLKTTYKIEELKQEMKNQRDKVDKQKDYTASCDNYEEAQEKVQKELEKIRKENEYDSITSCFDDLIQYVIKLENLQKKRDKLIEIQKREINQIIVDKDNNKYSFDGYGRLIEIEDKYENKISIEFDEDNHKMLSIKSNEESIVFNYDKKNSLLNSMVDSKGRRIEFKYNDNQDLIKIMYPDENYISMNNSKDNYFALISSLSY